MRAQLLKWEKHYFCFLNQNRCRSSEINNNSDKIIERMEYEMNSKNGNDTVSEWQVGFQVEEEKLNRS